MNIVNFQDFKNKKVISPEATVKELDTTEQLFTAILFNVDIDYLHSYIAGLKENEIPENFDINTYNFYIVGFQKPYEITTEVVDDLEELLFENDETMNELLEMDEIVEKLVSENETLKSEIKKLRDKLKKKQ